MATVRAWVAGCALALVALGPVAPAQTAAPPAPDQADAEALRVVDLWLDAVEAYDRIPAISASVVRNGHLVWAKGYGTIDRDHKVPASPTTIYSICSISKLFTSIALMQQWEQGKVDLDAPITTYLPWARVKPITEDTLPVTLRGVLTHSAGLPRESDFPYWAGAGNPFPTDAQLQARMPEQTALYPAQRRFQYSNLGLTLAGDTVAAVSGEAYADYARAHILEPLGLKDTRTYFPVDLLGTRMAVGWGALKRDGTRDPLPPFATRAITPAAGYTSTALDLARFAEWQFRLMRNGKAEVLKAATLREMQRVQFVDPDWKTMRGLGFNVSHIGDHTYVGHGGDCPGYHTAIALRPADETAVVVMETGAEPPSAWARAVFGVLDRRHGFAFREPARGMRLEDYTGRFSAQPWGNELIVAPWAGGLVLLSLPAANPAEAMEFLKPKGNDAFRVVRADGSEAEEVRFERGADGKVARFVVFSNPREKVADLPPG